MVDQVLYWLAILVVSIVVCMVLDNFKRDNDEI